MTHPPQDDSRHSQGNTIPSFTPPPESGAPAQPRTNVPESSDEALITPESDDTVPPELSDFLKTVQAENPKGNKGVPRLETAEAESPLADARSSGGILGTTSDTGTTDDDTDIDIDITTGDTDTDIDIDIDITTGDNDTDTNDNNSSEGVTLDPEAVLAERRVWEEIIEDIIKIHNIAVECEWKEDAGVFDKIQQPNDELARLFQVITVDAKGEFRKVIQALETTVREFEAQDEYEAGQIGAVETDSDFKYGRT